MILNFIWKRSFILFATFQNNCLPRPPESGSPASTKEGGSSKILGVQPVAIFLNFVIFYIASNGFVNLNPVGLGGQILFYIYPPGFRY